MYYENKNNSKKRKKRIKHVIKHEKINNKKIKRVLTHYQDLLVSYTFVDIKMVCAVTPYHYV